MAGRLRELGIAAVRLNTDALTDVDRVSKLLGRLTGHQRGADSVAAVFDTALAAKAAPDGYTLVGAASGPMAANLTLYKELAYDPQ